MKTPLRLALCLVAGLLPRGVQAQGTAFTYQGRLNDGANPANGTYDLRFALYDLSSAGTQQGVALTNANTTISNGLFTVTLDFGNQFPAAARWLEIGVRTNGNGAFATLAPRQQLTPTPYALTAENVLSGGIASGTYSNAVIFNSGGNSFNGTFSGNGAGLTNISLAAIANAGVWKTNGNTGANPTNGAFLGTADNLPLEIKVNNLRALRLEPMPNNNPNVIGGYSGNIVSNGFYGAVIAGGGTNGAPNRVGGVYASVLGGIGNAAVGNYSSTLGYANQAGGWSSVAMGANTTAAGNDSTAMGVLTVASGGNATAMGTNSVASGDSSTAMGFSTTASGNYSTAQGGNTTASGDYSLASGTGTTASGLFAVALGGSTTASGSAATALGLFSTASGVGSFASGGVTKATNSYATALGNNTLAGGVYSTAAGHNSISTSDSSVAMGYTATASNTAAIALGYNCVSGGGASVALGYFTKATGNSSTATGAGTSANNTYATAMGSSTVASGTSSTALGNGSSASGPSSTAMGESTSASGTYATAMGHSTSASGTSAFAVGESSVASGGSSVAMGYYCNAYLVGATAIGYNCTASQYYSTALGFNAQANNTAAFVWSDFSTTTGVGSVADNSVTMRAVGGYRLFSNTGSSSGVFLAGNANAWSSISDRNSKKNIVTVNYSEVLDKLAKVPVAQWNYKWEDDHDVPNIGPMAQDFKHAFYPGRDDKSISTLEFDGVELAAIQGLNQKIEETRAENAGLKQQLEEIKATLRELTRAKELRP